MMDCDGMPTEEEILEEWCRNAGEKQ